MSSKLTVEEVLSNLEAKAALHREQEAVHAQQEVHHRDQRAFHAAELDKILRSLESFRTVATAAVELARPPEPPEPKTLPAAEVKLPPPGRLLAGRLVKLVVASPDLAEPFDASIVAKEVNDRFAAHLPKPLTSRATSDVLRRMAAEGRIQIVQEGKPFHEARYVRKAGREAKG